MSCRGRIVGTLAAVAIALVLPSVAWAHAYLIKTVPAASGVLNVPPPNVALTYDEWDNHDDRHPHRARGE